MVPIEREGEGGEVGRRERMCDVGEEVGWTYCVSLVCDGLEKRRLGGGVGEG